MYKNILIGEYTTYFIKDDGSVWAYDDNKLTKYSLPEPVKAGSAGHPYANVIGNSGKVYHLLGDNKGPISWKPTPLAAGESSTSFYTHHVVIGEGGGLKVFKDDHTTVSLKVPGKIVKAVGAGVLLVLDDKGGVWKYNWIASGKIIKSHADLAKLEPERIPLPGPATDIATSRSLFSAAVVNGEVLVWCESFGAPYVGLTKASKPVNPGWGLKGVKQIAASDNTLHIIDGNDEMWGVGNNWCGEVGNGEIDLRVLAGNADYGNRLFVPKPVNISRARKWKNVWAGTYYAFRNYAEDMLGNIYAWGYPKFGLLSTGIKPQDDPKNIGIAAITVPWRVGIPDTLQIVSTADLKAGKVPYPPKEPRILIKTVISRHYDDGTIEIENQ